MASHPQNRAVQKYVLTSGQFRMKSRSDLEQTGNSSAKSDAPGRRACNLRQNFQQCTFSRAVLSDDADDFSLTNVKTDVPERPEVSADLPGGILRADTAPRIGFRAKPGPPPGEILLCCSASEGAQAVSLANRLNRN